MRYLRFALKLSRRIEGISVQPAALIARKHMASTIQSLTHYLLLAEQQHE